MEWYIYALAAIAGYVVLRFLLMRFLVRQAQRKAFYKDYVDVLTSPKYKVKSNYEN